MKNLDVVRGDFDRIGDWTTTYSGRVFWPLDPRPEEIEIADIAHALSQQCRWTGHTIEFVSVAQHSILVSENCAPRDALWGLLHDAAEAYLVDLASPIKHLKEFYVYREMESGILQMIARRFGLPEEIPESVHIADKNVLATEVRDCMRPGKMRPEWYGIPLKERIVPLSAPRAELLFLERFHELRKTHLQ